MSKTGIILPLRRYMSSRSPPSHFSDPTIIPPQYGLRTQNVNNSNFDASTKHNDNDSKATHNIPIEPQGSSSSRDKGDGFLREITSLLAMCSLGYLAVDNYANRIRLEKLNTETTAINLKTLQIQQANFANSRKKRDLQIIQERRDTNKRNFKMSLHIALLRKQLIDAGMKPIDIDQAIKEFESNVKADNSIKNVSGQALWIDDASPLKHYIPDAHEYDKKKFEGNSKS